MSPLVCFISTAWLAQLILHELVNEGNGDIEVPVVLSRCRSVLAVDMIMVMLLKPVLRCEVDVVPAMVW